MIIHNIILHGNKEYVCLSVCLSVCYKVFTAVPNKVPIDKTPKYSGLTTKRTLRGEVGFICERGKYSQLLSVSVHKNVW